MRGVGVPLLGLLLLVTPAMAQDADRIELKGVVGTFGFLDEVTDYHSVVGGAVRFHVSRVFRLEPEFLYMRESSRHEAYAFQTALIWEFRQGTGFHPYLVAGAGVLHSRFTFPGALRERFSSNEFTGGGGIGSRIRVGNRFWLSPELRIGWEPIIRATVSFGYTFH